MKKYQKNRRTLQYLVTHPKKETSPRNLGHCLGCAMAITFPFFWAIPSRPSRVATQPGWFQSPGSGYAAGLPWNAPKSRRRCGSVMERFRRRDDCSKGKKGWFNPCPVIGSISFQTKSILKQWYPVIEISYIHEISLGIYSLLGCPVTADTQWFWGGLFPLFR